MLANIITASVKTLSRRPIPVKRVKIGIRARQNVRTMTSEMDEGIEVAVAVDQAVHAVQAGMRGSEIRLRRHCG